MTYSPFTRTLYQYIPSHAAGFVALADLSTIARRSALTGTASLIDIPILCPGLHRQLQQAPELNKSEYPACAALTTGYVFRVENPATVLFLQKVGRTGCLTTLDVSSSASSSSSSSFSLTMMISNLAYLTAVGLTICAGAVLYIMEDRWGLLFLLVLILVRAVHTIILRRRTAPRSSWKGASEPGVQGDLLILLSQDRWIRMRGMVDDLKAVTSGQWMREETFIENTLVSLATVVMYFNAAVTGKASPEGNLVLVGLLVGSAGLVGLANECTEGFHMDGRIVRNNTGLVKKYRRRRDLADELIEETGRDDWAVRLGMIVREQARGESEKIM